MDHQEIKNIVEALLMSSSTPVPMENIMAVFDEWQIPKQEELEQVLIELEQDYATRAIELKHLASGYCFQTKQRYSSWIARLLSEKPAKYSQAFLEVLAIIAYKQPVTRADIEEIRGVAVSSTMIKTLIEREWVRIAGYRDVPGKPAVYTTTKAFLDYFNLTTLNDLPQSVTNNE